MGKAYRPSRTYHHSKDILANGIDHAASQVFKVGGLGLHIGFRPVGSKSMKPWRAGQMPRGDADDHEHAGRSAAEARRGA